MIRYEIRILRPNAKPFLVSTTMAGDFYALKRARALAGERDGYEVWRGMKCIYRSPALSQLARNRKGRAALKTLPPRNPVNSPGGTPAGHFVGRDAPKARHPHLHY